LSLSVTGGLSIPFETIVNCSPYSNGYCRKSSWIRHRENGQYRNG
jgi:hypothetical protein